MYKPIGVTMGELLRFLRKWDSVKCISLGEFNYFMVIKIIYCVFVYTIYVF